MTVGPTDKPLILASQSAARQALLQHAGVAFEVVPADIDERAIALASKGRVCSVTTRCTVPVPTPSVLPIFTMPAPPL